MMMRSHLLRTGARPGALAGVAGGLAFGAAMVQLGNLPTVASLVRATTPEVGFIVHMAIAAIVGAGFGMLVRDQYLGAGEVLFWGLTYGSLWWFLGPLTLSPLLRGGVVVWDVPTAQAAFPSLLGHLWYGAVTAIAYALLRRHAERRPRGAGTLLLGVLAGLAGAWLLRRLLDVQVPWLTSSGMVNPVTHHVAGPAILLMGLGAGVGFALLYPHLNDGSGPVLVRGAMYGFAWWVAGALTLMPLLSGEGLAWSVDAVRARFPALPGFVLSGAFVAIVYRWLDALGGALFSDDIGARDEEGIGIRGLRAVARGAVAGMIGGLVFTVIMLRIGVLPTVARLVGASSPWTGFLVHLVIANLIGASFGLLFLRRSVDVGSALGWGVSYGFFWWILGPLTLHPVLLGEAPRWTPEVAGALMPSLIGHLAYGAALGVTFHLLEARYNPWWVSHTDAEAAHSARRRDQVLTSAPALWALVVVIALTLPLVLSCGMPQSEDGFSMAAQAGGYTATSPYTRTEASDYPSSSQSRIELGERTRSRVGVPPPCSDKDTRVRGDRIGRE
jgi:uncharacterized membrane protein YagU involved in acid resistance